MDLVDVVITAPIPSISDGISTATAIFAGIVNPPADGVFEYSVGGSWVSSVTSGQWPQITAVRMRIADFPARTSPRTFELRLATSDTAGGLAGRAVMSESLLPDADTQFTQTVGVCPGRLVVAKNFDADDDGARGAGEPALSGWRFDVADSGGNVIRTLQTLADGQASMLLNPGTYTVTEQLVQETAGLWRPTTSVDGTQSVAIVTDGVHALEFGNVCECADDGDGDACTTLECQPSGACLFVDLSGMTCADDPGDICLVAGSGHCDPATGSCGYDAMTCGGETLTVFGAVEGPSGELGSVTCELNTISQQLTCLTEADGTTLAVDLTPWCN